MMSDTAFIVISGTVAAALVALVLVVFQARQIDDLRKDMSRVSTIQVKCAGSTEYGQCVDVMLDQWASEQRR